jgi:hypothetical protein
MSSILVSHRFNGPLESGNGGYCAGIVAGFIDGDAEVSLRSPVPLDKQLEIVSAEGTVTLRDGELIVAEGHPIDDVELEVPSPVTIDEAELASEGYMGSWDDQFSRCFVCGRAREDSFELFAGPVEGRELVASPWRPRAWTADESGHVRPEFVWAVLDCPTAFAVWLDGEQSNIVLARLGARLPHPVPADEEHVVVGWPIDRDGRKHHAGSAVFTADGELLAVATALLIEPRDS